jgi:hypothetical protein
MPTNRNAGGATCETYMHMHMHMCMCMCMSMHMYSNRRTTIALTPAKRPLSYLRHRRHPEALPIKMLTVAAIACSLLVRPAAVPLHRTPAPARLSSPQMATEELIEQFVDWVPAAAAHLH